MRGIELELLSDNLPKLKEQYRNETPEEKQKRAVRYNKAFAEYDKQFVIYMAELHEKVMSFRKQAIIELESRDRNADQSKMDEMESFFSAA